MTLMNTTKPMLLPFAHLTDDDSALIAYLARLEADERVREFSEEY